MVFGMGGRSTNPFFVILSTKGITVKLNNGLGFRFLDTTLTVRLVCRIGAKNGWSLRFYSAFPASMSG